MLCFTECKKIGNQGRIVTNKVSKINIGAIKETFK